MSHSLFEQDQQSGSSPSTPEKSQQQSEKQDEKEVTQGREGRERTPSVSIPLNEDASKPESPSGAESRPIERPKAPARPGARGTAAMDPKTRQEVARKGGLAVSRNKQHMAEIGRKGGQSVSKNREHMAQIGRKGGAASRGHR